MSGWIKCSDRLPMEDLLVIASGDMNNRPGKWVEPAIFQDGDWYAPTIDDYTALTVADYDIEMNNVTHWMLLPDPPAE